MHVSLFVTCLTDQFYPRVGKAVVELLEKFGCTVDFPQGQTCCGQPMFNNGYFKDAATLARRMIEVFEEADYVITPSGSCCAMIHEQYPKLLSDDPAYADRCQKLVGKSYEFVQFLTDVLKVDLRKLGCKYPAKVTYHYSCHLRGLGMTTETIDLLDQIEGIEYRPLEKMDECCGFGGTFAIKMAPISGAMAQDKVNCIKKTGADVVIVNDGGCSMNIAGACNRQNVDVQFKHIAEILAEGLGLNIDD